jgi:hypothetical protein
MLVDLALGEPALGTRTIAGPEVHRMPDLVRQVLRVDGSHRAVVPVRLPGAVGRAMAGDALLDFAPDVRGKQTFAEWLDDRRQP